MRQFATERWEIDSLTTVSIVNDIQALRSSWQLALDMEPGICVVGEAENGPEAVALVENQDPDVLLMGVEMSTVDGIEATRQLRNRNPTRPLILLVSLQHDEAHVADAFLEGAKGHVFARTKVEELILIVRRIASGERVFPDNINSIVKRHLAKDKPVNQHGAPVDKLTKRETEVTRLVALGSSQSEICDKLYITKKTVKTHLQNIYNKRGVKNPSLRDPRYIVVLALQEGLVDPDELVLKFGTGEE